MTHLKRSARTAATAIAAAVVVSVPATAFDPCLAADVTRDGVVDQADLDQIGAFDGYPASERPREDLDGGGVVDAVDLAMAGRFTRPCRRCIADLGGEEGEPDYVVDGGDVALLADRFGFDCSADLNRDGVICPWDMQVLIAYGELGPPLSPAALRADLDGDGDIDSDDRAVLDALIPDDPNLYETRCRADLNRDGAVGPEDLVPLLAAWGECPEEPDQARGYLPPIKICDPSDDE